MLLPLAILAVLLILNGFFAMAELAMMTSRQSRLQLAAAKGSSGAATALSLSREPTRFLSTVQVGITLIGILSGAFGERALSGELQMQVARVSWLAGYSEPISLVIVVLVITYFSLVVGELVPKRLALAHPEAIASFIAKPLNLLSKVAAWPVRVLTLSTDALLKVLRVKQRGDDDVSEDDVKALVARAASTGIFDPLEHKLFQRVFRVGDLTVESLMVPRSDIVWIDEDEPIADVRVLVGTSPHSHFPVCRRKIDQLIGVIHIKDLITYGLLAGTDFKVGVVAQQPMFIPGTMPALNLLDQFQRTKTHVAFVVDEYGGTQGLITLNDVVRAVVGDIPHRTEEPGPAGQRRGDGSWLLDGSLPLHEMAILLNIAPEAMAEFPGVNTVAGLALAQLGHIPVPGEKAVWRGFMLEVVDMDGTRIDKVLAMPLKA
ncbi:MAG: hemolysin family protein [Planctomycetes bacterium]|nr:hemolysin family protein [Planctomycetota bacterium]